MGGGGFCKHVAALLLTWQARPDDFVEIEELDATLERRSKTELIALVKQMLRQDPDLELLLETPLPGAPAAPVDPAVYQRQVAAVFRRHGREWHDAADVAAELLAITAIGDGFVEQQNDAGAVAVYQAVSSAVLENYEEFHEENGELIEVVRTCTDGLGECLDGESRDAATREAILRALFAVYRFGVDFGGIDISAGVPELLVKQTTAEERRTIAGWVREAMPAGRAGSASSSRKSYGGLLLDLEADALDDEAFLRVCRETGRSHDLVERLLALGRLDEAIKEAERAGDDDLIGLADLFVSHGQGDVAERIVLDGSERTRNTRLMEWLKDRYQARGDDAAALEQARKVFSEYPNLAGYQELRELAGHVGAWEAMRPELLAFLRRPPNAHVLVQVFLDEGEIDQALELVESERAFAIRHAGDDLRLEVARAAEPTRPGAALEIYRQYAEALIAQRGRDKYQPACSLLKRVRALHERLGERDVWTTYIADLRERNRTLRALKEELTAAGL